MTGILDNTARKEAVLHITVLEYLSLVRGNPEQIKINNLTRSYARKKVSSGYMRYIFVLFLTELAHRIARK